MNQALKQRRMRAGLNQEQLAELVRKRSRKAFSQQAYQKLEAKLAAGEEVSSGFMHHILAVFDELEGNTKLNATPEDLQMLSKLNSLSAEDRAAIEVLIDTCSQKTKGPP